MQLIVKNRTAQLIFQSFYCAFGLVGIAGGLGLFERVFYWDFYVYFTNISTYLCIGIMLAELVQTARRPGDGCVSVLPRLKFITLLATILTALVFNFLLAGAPNRDPAWNFKPGSIMFHLVLPTMYLLDWVLFYEHGKVRRSTPVQAAVFPLAYVCFVFLHAWMRHFDTSILNYSGSDPVVYPYFFLNPDRVGWNGVLQWSVILLLAFVASGFLFFGIDRLLAAGGRKR